MIYTVTFSPAIDYVIDLDELKLGETNRSKGEAYYFGGKGINVSTVLSLSLIHISRVVPDT